MNKIILLVEDDKLIRESLARVLTEKGLTVYEASNGKEGLEKALLGDVDLIVTDIMMPEVDGLTMLGQLREDSKGKDIPVIILTSDEQTESLNKAMEVGVATYLSKSSLSADEIAEQIQASLASE